MRSGYTISFWIAIALADQVEFQKRQAPNGAKFTSAADQLISSYVGPGALAPLAPAIQAAASVASVFYIDVTSLVSSALEADPIPGWFTSAIPSAYQANVAALESGISELRAAAAIASQTVPIVLAITTTDTAGHTITASVFTTDTAPVTTSTTTISFGTALTTTTAPAGSIVISPPQSTSLTTFTDSAGSLITSGVYVGVNGASSVGSQAVSGASSVGTEAIGNINSAGSVAVSGASSVVSQGVSGASSVIGAASSFFAPPTSTGAAPATSTSGSAAGKTISPEAVRYVLGALGLIFAL